MSNDLKSIHDFDFTMICNYFKLLERQGPGSPEVTQKAVSFINELSDEAKIADIGCGTGGQTMVLANYTKGQITGIDLFPDFIEIFNRNAANTHCENRLKGIVGSMDNLPFQNEELDLIWSEGILGNHDGYRSWQLNEGRQMPADVLPVTARRIGEVPGIHAVTYKSEVDEIEIRHSAVSREGFARGAVLAAEFLKGKNGVLGMEDMLKF